MHHLKNILFGIILLSSFGSAFADEYDPNQDVFDQIINALVPTLIVFLFDTKEPEDKKKQEDNKESEEQEKLNVIRINLRNSKDLDEEETENSDKTTSHKSSIFEIVKRVSVKIKGISPIKIRRVFDDFLFLLSLFVLPTTVFFKNHQRFAIPFWIPVLFCITTVFVFIILITNQILFHLLHRKNNLVFYVFVFSALAIDFSHVVSDICFVFYTRSIPTSSFTDVFIYSHAVTGIASGIFLPFFVLGVFIHNKVYCKMEVTLRELLIEITFIWTPVVQMLNMSLLSGNDYYWTKSILAINLIYLSRVINYIRVKRLVYIRDIENFGMVYSIFSLRRQKMSQKESYVTNET
ncbi:hypothetical protein RclHR1_10120002 [Rhizophagus clarus]|uniref:Uncharacterized protein n=1 Tax=Rhizophagus clarus TaxID=94130 RepID=A0A2Z6Q5D2_9GLOM|nr:hypothetical protein RclHR1_10120002 [Rhizophagus clarus]GES85133.1 hypothetical protein GLOIN_2v1471985 [Rhizophagus clarus]